MPENEQQKRDWIDIGLKAATPLIVGIVIAWVGLFGDETLTRISNQQQSARLLTELQIKREQAESELRKDIFAQALDAFLLKGRATDGKVGPLSQLEMSKQLLRLELLALNFGDSLSLSPLFAEMRKDLTNSRPVNEDEKRGYADRRSRLLKRLNSLAQRVASTQLSSLEKHGIAKSLVIPLYEYRNQAKQGKPCIELLLEEQDFAWPADNILWQMGELDDQYRPVTSQEEVNSVMEEEEYRNDFDAKAILEFQGIKRYIEVHVSDVNHCNKSAKVQILVKRKILETGSADQSGETTEADPEFRLDYFNFPMVDNTRLWDNHRFAIVAENFRLDNKDPRIEITAVVFPSEYASLRDRPGMQEVRKLLESALQDEVNDDN